MHQFNLSGLGKYIQTDFTWKLLLWAFAVSNTPGILCDELLNKLLKGVTLVEGRSRLAIFQRLYPTWNIDRVLPGIWTSLWQRFERHRKVCFSLRQGGRELAHTFVFNHCPVCLICAAVYLLICLVSPCVESFPMVRWGPSAGDPCS